MNRGPALLATWCHLERPCRAEGALSMRGPGGRSWISEFPGFRYRTVAVSCARRTACTHHETLAREPALAPAPGMALRSRDSRPSRICAVDPAIGGRTHSESRIHLCWRRGVPPGASLLRRRRTFDESPGGRSWNQAVLDPDTDQWLCRALDGLRSPITRSSHASQRTPPAPGRAPAPPCDTPKLQQF